MQSKDQFQKDNEQMRRASWMRSFLQFGPALTSAQKAQALRGLKANEDLATLASSSTAETDSQVYQAMRARLGLPTR